MERRQPVRLSGLDLPGVFDHRIPLRIVDLSERGIGVESCRPLPFLPWAELRVDPRSLALSVRVTWSKLVRVGNPWGPTYRAGVQLLDPSFELIRSLLEVAAAQPGRNRGNNRGRPPSDEQQAGDRTLVPA